jgi:hypothetical protein
MFLEFFFLSIHAGIDWKRGYESLVTELRQITRDAKVGSRRIDRLYRVWRLDGGEAWIVIHIEIQNQPDTDFPQRMFVYYYRLFDLFHRPLVSLAVLGDEQPDWRPSSFDNEMWGCKVRLEFPVVKLLDFGHDLTALESAPNPFALVVLAHLQTVATKKLPETRKAWKFKLVKGLFERGLDADTVRQLFLLIDWMMDLPKELDMQFNEELHRYEEEKRMPYISSVERLAAERGEEKGEVRGLRKGIALGLKLRFGAAGGELLPAVEKVTSLANLTAFHNSIESAQSVEELRRLLPAD